LCARIPRRSRKKNWLRKYEQQQQIEQNDKRGKNVAFS
jgi:hypothetical protein